MGAGCLLTLRVWHVSAAAQHSRVLGMVLLSWSISLGLSCRPSPAPGSQPDCPVPPTSPQTTLPLISETFGLVSWSSCCIGRVWREAEDGCGLNWIPQTHPHGPCVCVFVA